MEATAELWMGTRKGARERPEAREDLLAERRPGEGLEEGMHRTLESPAPFLCPFAFIVLCLCRLSPAERLRLPAIILGYLPPSNKS